MGGAAGHVWDLGPPGPEHRAAYADAAHAPFWLDRPEAPAPADPLDGEWECDLAIVGGGLSGLWAAVLAKEDDPGRDVALIEGAEIAHAASGRNGGFFLSSLTHGVANGMARFPEEVPALESLGLQNFDQAVASIGRLGIECDLELNGDINIALEPHEDGWLAEEAEQLRDLGHDVVLLDAEAMRGEVASPTYRTGMWQRSGSGIVDPARLCWGLRRAALDAGVRIFERTPVTAIADRAGGLELAVEGGALRCRHVLLATSAFPALVRSVRRRVVPVYDYVLVTEPLGPGRMRSIGWKRRQGLGDCANQFHYYRLTADNRILWGGFNAIYHFGNRMGEELEHSDECFARLSQHFFTTFPQLEGVRFTHRWAGAIDTCSRFFAFYGTSHGGRVAHAVGHTGLGVGASRFGARVALDLLAGRETEATRLRAIRSHPLPFPPEPLRWAAIELTRNRLAAADRRAGRRGLWLRALDRLGLGYDS
jgi:glycine/D-amino acid oxidase-like deaminating enzyme